MAVMYRKVGAYERHRRDELLDKWHDDGRRRQDREQKRLDSVLRETIGIWIHVASNHKS